MSQADEVRAAADIVKIVGDYVKLRKGGANLMGLCPFHQEKTPSFAVHPVKQIFHCFGCGVGGDVFKFVMLIENVSFPEALSRIAEKVGITLRERVRGGAEEAAAGERAALHKIHEVAAKFFSGQLGASVEGRAARAYLADRGLSDERVGQFRLGYAPSEGTALARHLASAGFSSDVVEKSGLVVRDSERQRSYDRFRRRVIFPIANDSGRVVAFGGRALGDDPPKYLNSPETSIYIKGRILYHLDAAGAAIRKLDYAVLVEGYMDCIAVASCGIGNVVASCGTSLTESQVRLLSRYSRKVVVNFDPDSAGVAATERSVGALLEGGFEVKVLALPGGLDPDAFVRHRGAAAYRELLSAAPTYLDYLTERAAAEHDLTRPEGKVRAANAVLPYLTRVPSPLLRAELANRLAERLRVDRELLREELRRAAVGREREVREEGASTARASPAERELVRAFLENEALANEFLPRLVEEGACEGLPSEGVMKRLLEARRRGEKIELSNWGEVLGSEEQRLVYESLLTADSTLDRGRALASFRALKRRKAERESERIQAEIQAAERAGDRTRLSQLLEAKGKLARELAELGRG